MNEELLKNKTEDLWLEGYGELFTDLYFEKYLNHYTIKHIIQDDEVIACIAYRPSEYVINGKVLRCSYILKPLVKDGYSKEYGKKLLEETLQTLSRHEVLSFIGLDDVNLYEEYGFEKIYKRKIYNLNHNNVPILNNYEVSFSASDIDMLKCYGKFTSHFNGYKLRNDKDFNELKGYKISAGGKFVYFYDEEELKAYASYYENEEGVFVDEIIYLDSLSFVSIISYLIDNYHNVRLSISIGENLDFLAHNLRYEDIDFLMARINDYETFNRLFNSNVSSVVEGYLLSRKHPYGNESF